MPEEINRLLTDQISDLLFVTEAVGGSTTCGARASTLDKVHFVGNVMIDTLLAHARKRALALDVSRTARPRRRRATAC